MNHFRVHDLWDELADFPAAQTDAAFVHLMTTICGWLKADDALWVGGVRVATGAAAAKDPQHGWRGRAVRYLDAPPVPRKILKRAVRGQDSDPAMTTCAITAHAGRFRHYRMHDGFVDFAAFRDTAHYVTYYESVGISDRIWIVCPVSRDTEAYYLWDLFRTRRRFSAENVALAAYALRGLKRLHRDILTSYGLPMSPTPLSPMQRQLFAELLTEKSEKEIAKTLKLTPGTTHQYVVELCRQLRVSGRAGLIALWLGQTPPATDQ